MGADGFPVAPFVAWVLFEASLAQQLGYATDQNCANPAGFPTMLELLTSMNGATSMSLVFDVAKPGATSVLPLAAVCAGVRKAAVWFSTGFTVPAPL
jgi:hypothetical protein